MADGWPDGHTIHEHLVNPFIDKVSEKAESDVTIEHFGGGQLGGSRETLSMVREGVADITQIAPAYFSDQMPLGQVGDLPGQFTDNEVAQQALWELYQPGEILHENDLEPLGLRVVAVNFELPYQYHNLTNDKVVEIEDFQGNSIRVAGGIMHNTVEQLGGSPVEVAAEDAYSSAQRGTVDAWLIGANIGPLFDIDQFFKSVTSNVNLGSWAGLWAMQEETFQDLPSDAQDAMLAAGEEVAPEYGRAIMEVEQETLDQFEEQGIDVYEVPDSAYQEWIDQALDPVKGMWAEGMEERDYPGQEALEEWDAAMERARS